MAHIEVMDGRGLLLDLADRGGDALVMLGTPACGACRRARQVLAGMGEADLGGPGLIVASVDATHAMGLVNEWEVRHFPALVLVRAGDPWARVSATLDVAALSAAIQAARGGPPDDAL